MIGKTSLGAGSEARPSDLMTIETKRRANVCGPQHLGYVGVVVWLVAGRALNAHISRSSKKGRDRIEHHHNNSGGILPNGLVTADAICDRPSLMLPSQPNRMVVTKIGAQQFAASDVGRTGIAAVGIERHGSVVT